jgi:hypothetical protein
MDAKTIEVLESKGHTVIRGYKHMVVDHGEVDGVRSVAGLEENGDLIEFGSNGAITIPSGKPHKVYVGNSVSSIRSKMRSRVADTSNGTVNDVENIETALAAGKINSPQREKRNVEISVDRIGL